MYFPLPYHIYLEFRKIYRILYVMKTCRKCNTLKELSEFNKRTNSKDGLEYICRECNSKHCKGYYLKNKDHHNEKVKKWFSLNPDRSKIYDRDYYLKNKGKFKQYNLDNKEKINKYLSMYTKQRRQSDSLYKFSHNIRTLIYSSFKNKGYRKNTKTELILGCDVDEFKDYIQSQFLHPMSFNNHGPIWEIDHIIPLISAKNEDDIIKLNYYTNLRPLFKTKEIASKYGYDNYIGNRNKGASLTHI